MLDLNDAEPQRSGELIPDGAFAKVRMTIRPGGVDGTEEIDKGLLKASISSDALMLDCEFTVLEGPYARRKFWQNFTVRGGKLDERGVSIGWKMSKTSFRAMIESAQGLDPEDMSAEARARRSIRGLSDLNGVSFVAKIRIEPPADPRYGEANRLDRVVQATEPEWRKVMDGEAVPPAPSSRPARAAQPKPQPQPAWTQPAPTQPQQPAAKPAARPAGPAWLNG